MYVYAQVEILIHKSFTLFWILDYNTYMHARTYMYVSVSQPPKPL